ncbi:TIGR01212 family radical SAM protein [Ruminococcus sp.]|uniref:TIGR01212 family radical SAM protein n=1 Tax=Ruminococcus sp. TaxID=41978 RepID=UPI002C23C9A3|nr:TIGR01212 family radical SAM protein [Ruminococcus sp.]HNZ98127.1 TIGR01212 family radical SAM protein [Ruminococcus sp.]HOH86166.1 TIGR01212 family radical SAM protein [Ruminococcus sp.]
MSRSPFPFSCDNKRYHTLNYYNRTKFGGKIYKAVIDCGFTCPNIDGTKGTGGCIFCDGGSGYFTHSAADITGQLELEHKRITHKYGEGARFIAYFQANTNTYAPVDTLSEHFETALSFPNVCGISIGTRGDCLSDDVFELLKEINRHTVLTVELGMQSCHNSTIKHINRCCTHEEFLEGFYKLKSAGIRTCLHIINGLPFENEEMMLETAKELARLSPEAVKIQMLHVIVGTELEKWYNEGRFSLIGRDEYINIVVKQLELLPPSTVIERITGDGDKRKLIAPDWTRDKIAVLGGIDKRLAELDTWQGRLYK